MKIIAGRLDFEAMTARVKFYTKREGDYIEFKIFYDTKAIFSNKIRIATFKKIYAKLTKVMDELEKSNTES